MFDPLFRPFIWFESTFDGGLAKDSTRLFELYTKSVMYNKNTQNRYKKHLIASIVKIFFEKASRKVAD